MSSHFSFSGIRSASQLLSEDLDSSSSGISSEEQHSIDSAPVHLSELSGAYARSTTPLSLPESTLRERDHSEANEDDNEFQRRSRRKPKEVLQNSGVQERIPVLIESQEFGKDELFEQYHKTLSMFRQLNKVFNKENSLLVDQAAVPKRDESQIDMYTEMNLRSRMQRCSHDPENRSVSVDHLKPMDVDMPVSDAFVQLDIAPRKLTNAEVAELDVLINKRRITEVLVPNYRNRQPVRFFGIFSAKDQDFFNKLMLEINIKSDKKKLCGKISRHDVVLYLRANEPDRNVIQDLFYAALKSHRKNLSQIGVICLLISNGADCDRAGSSDESPLKMALNSGDLSVFELILRCSKDPIIDADKNTALQLATDSWLSREKTWDFVSFVTLYPVHSDIFHKNIRGKSVLSTLVSCPDFKFDHLEELVNGYGVMRLRDNNTYGIGHLLASAGRIDLLYLAINRFPCDINQKDREERTILHILAAMPTWTKSDIETLAEIVQTHKGNLRLKDKFGQTPLEIAERYGNKALKAYWELAGANKFRYNDGVLIKDISYGCETFPIKVVNDKKNSDRVMDKFVYVRQNIYLGDCPTTKSVMRCGCSPGTCSLTTCICLQRGLGYSARGTIIPGTCKANPIFECGPHCGCGPDCASRVVQRGIRMPFEIFLTHSRGWGVRATRTIEPGEYIMDFSGEVVESDRLLARDENNDWAMELTVDNYEGTPYHVDPTRVGNVARFLNHSCDPNLFAVRVYQSGEPVDTGVRMAMFSAQRIAKNRELTFFYGECYWERVTQTPGVFCHCNAKKCNWKPKKGAKK